MELPFGMPLVIANPRAGRGRSDVLDRLLSALRTAGVEPRVAATSCRGDAAEVARRAVADGVGYLVVVGGDGTVHEVVNGMFAAADGGDADTRPVVAVVGAGSGSDLVRTFGLDRPPEALVRHLISADVLPIDVGRARLRGVGGAAVERLFVNVAEVGYGGRVVQLANRLPRRLGRGRYAAAIVASVPSFRRARMTVEHDNGVTEDELCNVLVANGQFFGGGMLVAPRALPTDGRFNLQAWGGTPIDVLRAQPQLRTGRHLQRSDVREWQSATVRVQADRPQVVEADGEVLGTTPVTFDLLPQALRLKL